MAQRRRLAKRRSIAASIVASAAVTVAAGPMRTITWEEEAAVPERTEQVFEGTSTSFLAPNEPVVETIDLGLEGDTNQAQGAYAREFANDLAATQLSREQISGAADQIAKAQNLLSVAVTGKASDDDDSISAGLGITSEKNQELAALRGQTAADILATELSARGVQVPVSTAPAEEVVLSAEQISEFKKLVAQQSADRTPDSITNDELETYIENFNAGEPVPQELVPFLHANFTNNRGARIDYTYANPDQDVQGAVGICTEHAEYITLVFPEKPARDGELSLPWLIPVPLFKKRNDELEGQDISTENIETGSSSRSSNTPQQQISVESRATRATAAVRPHWSTRLDQFAFKYMSKLTPTKESSLARKIAPYIAAAVLLGGVGAVLKPMYWGPEFDEQGCATGNNTFMPDPLQAKTPEKDCGKRSTPNAPKETPLTLTNCLDQHPGAKTQKATIEIGRTIVRG